MTKNCYRRMQGSFHGALRIGVMLLAFLLAAVNAPAKPPKGRPEPIMLVVMDPLAKELACACVKGYGQRDYRKLAAQLEHAVKQHISIEFSDDLAESMKGVSPGREVIVIGDRSLVADGAKRSGLKCRAVCELTDLEGDTTLRGLFIARSDDAAVELKDIGGRKVLFGVVEADAKYNAGMEALRAAAVTPAVKPERRGSYSEAALDVLDSTSTPPPVAIIPGYAMPLLTGCGSVEAGHLEGNRENATDAVYRGVPGGQHPAGRSRRNFFRLCSASRATRKC